MIKFSYMTSFYSKKVQRYVPSPEITPMTAKDWTEFSKQLQALQDIEYDRKDLAPLISPAFYDEVLRRKNENVCGWSFLALDFDNGRELTFDDATQWIESLGYTYIAYTTASSKPHWHKFRIFIPFSRDVNPEEMDTVWKGAFEYFGRLTDPVCKDKSRGYYVPGTYPGAYKDFEYSINNSIDPETLKKYAPVEAPKQLIQTALPDNFTQQCYWTGLNDCPFIRQRWINEYLGLPSGQDQHYQALYTFMLRVAGAAKKRAHRIGSIELANLASELDRMKDSRWKHHGRSWHDEADNAINYIYGGN